jgi:hypothetical protein
MFVCGRKCWIPKFTFFPETRARRASEKALHQPAPDARRTVFCITMLACASITLARKLAIYLGNLIRSNGHFYARLQVLKTYRYSFHWRTKSCYAGKS